MIKQKKYWETNKGLLLIFSMILTIGFLVFKKPALYAFGASANSIVYAEQYITIYLLGTVFVQLAVGLNTFISGQGNAKVAMLSVLIGAVINIVLDPILIFGLKMGVKGAALATVISQSISAVWVVRFLLSEKSVIRIKKKNLKLDKKIILSIAALGVSPFIMQSTESLVTITLNSGLQSYGGDIYVGSMSILMSVMQLVMIPVQGITQGIQPILSYNFGAGNKERVMGAFKRMIAVCLTMTLAVAGTAILMPEIFTGIFTGNRELAELTNRVMPVFFIGTTIFGIQSACQSMFIALGKAKISVFIAMLRKIILLIPLAIVLPKFVGVMGIYYAEAVADTLSVLATTTIFLFSYKKFLHECEKNGIMDTSINTK